MFGRIKAILKSFAAAIFIGIVIGSVNVLFEKVMAKLTIKA